MFVKIRFIPGLEEKQTNEKLTNFCSTSETLRSTDSIVFLMQKLLGKLE